MNPKTPGWPILLLYLVLSWLPAGALAADDRTAKTKDGLVRGELIADGKVAAFLGVPYAAPPVGSLRWAPPRAAASWTGVRDAAHFAAHCLQARTFADMSFLDAGASEDCLYLNIYRPSHSKTGRGLPVMVWIHGGGYAAGSASEPRHWGAYLPQNGIVLVTINYRLGLFGFWTTPGSEKNAGASGNYGLEDMVAALEWVKQDIAAFGGDPGNVTLFGESAGSFAVSTLMAAPSAQGLFTRAIGESGGAFGAQSYPPLAAQEQKNAALLGKLQAGSAVDLRALPAQTLAERYAAAGSPPLGPVVDGAFLKESVADTFAAGRQARIPLLAGWNRDEAAVAAKGMTKEKWQGFARQRFNDRSDEFLKLYPAGDDASAERSAADYYSDRFIVCGTWAWVEAHRKTGGAPIYRYQLDLAAPKSKFHDALAFHSDDIEYVFGTLESRPQSAWRDEDRRLSATMMLFWTNFAKTGNPNGAGPSIWPEFGATQSVMHLDNPVSAALDRRGQACRFLMSAG
jgi:para-nitrobenzyl esterase